MKPVRAAGPRVVCVKVLQAVIERRRYLDTALDEMLPLAGTQGSLVQEMSYGTLRWYHQLDAILAQLLAKPLKEKDRDLHLLLLLGLYQLRAMRVPPHAVVDETVECVQALGKPWAKGLVNACLRTFLRDVERGGARTEGIVARDPVARFSHPAWFIDALRQDRPEHWEQILEANNQRAPLSLRVNLQRQSRVAYLDALAQAGIAARPLACVESAVVLETPVAVAALPGFADGAASVQDAAAQLAAPLLDTAPGMRVLDACAAPGGKCAHLLEHVPGIELLALDNDAARLPRIQANLARLRLAATVALADATDVDHWWDRRAFDRILLDTPCSATGVIRRHPDIKLRRQPADFAALADTQMQLLTRLWPTLRQGGKLLYATCSVLARENEERIGAFLAAHTDAAEVALGHEATTRCRYGIQVLPGVHTMDGFFYACLVKR